MDEIELMVAETFRHFHEHFATPEETETTEPLLVDEDDEIPSNPGLLYHIQKSASVFVIRSLVSKNIRNDFHHILNFPEDYPSLRLLDGSNSDIEKRLRFFILENYDQAEIIHDQLSNRRYPINEEIICNLSDPGFSWWLSCKGSGFQLSFTLSVGVDDQAIKLGPLGDQQLTLRSFQKLQNLLVEAGFNLNIQNEVNRVQFNEGDDFLLEELKDLFEFGVLGDGMTKLFKLLARRTSDHSELETLWYYLQEVAAMRRFWIQVQYDLESL
jgi:hypothetical protein